MFKKENYNIVIMDGSDQKVLNNILGVVSMVGYRDGGKFNYKPIDEDHPTMIRIDFKTFKSKFEVIRDIIEDTYPGLCVFNPAL